MEIFWRTIAYYNSATWLLQIVIILIGIALTGLLIGRPRPWVKMAMKFYMIGLYTWISLVYYYIYCEERSYNGGDGYVLGGDGYHLDMGCDYGIYYLRTYPQI